MDRRRMMMSGKPKPLFVFKPGEKLQNYSETKRKRNVGNEEWRSANNYILYKPSENDPQKLFLERGVRAPTENKTPVIRIAVPLKKTYTKLFVTASSPNSGNVKPDSGNVDNTAFNSYIGWSTNSNGENDNLTLIYDEERVFEFDISKRDRNSDNFYLFFRNAQLMGDITISDIHFE